LPSTSLCPRLRDRIDWGLPGAKTAIRAAKGIDDRILAQVRSAFPSAVGLFAVGPPPLPGRDIELVVVTPQSGATPFPRYLWHDLQRVTVHHHRPNLYGGRLHNLLSTPWGRAKLTATDEFWELRAARIIEDPEGIIEPAHLCARKLASYQDARTTRTRASLFQLHTLTTQLTRLAGMPERHQRRNAALRLATGIYALSRREDFCGLCGLILKNLCQAGDAGYGGPAGLWANGHAIGTYVEINGAQSPLAGLRACHGFRPWTTPPSAVYRSAMTALATESLALALGALSQLRGQEECAVERLGSYYRQMIAQDAEQALVTIRGEMARELHGNPTYLTVCGVRPVAAEGSDPADSWPELLARLSSALTGAQATTSLGLGLASEAFAQAAAAHVDAGESPA
jgi:hypothetical protein